MTEKIRTFYGDYDAKLSVANSMGEVEKLWQENLCGKSMTVAEAEGYFRQIDMWLSVAQVHATAALVYAQEALLVLKQPKTCRCIRD